MTIAARTENLLFFLGRCSVSLSEISAAFRLPVCSVVPLGTRFDVDKQIRTGLKCLRVPVNVGTVVAVDVVGVEIVALRQGRPFGLLVSCSCNIRSVHELHRNHRAYRCCAEGAPTLLVWT
jgi:hypothetical protein